MRCHSTAEELNDEMISKHPDLLKICTSMTNNTSSFILILNKTCTLKIYRKKSKKIKNKIGTIWNHELAENVFVDDKRGSPAVSGKMHGPVDEMLT